jgi:hypothetical protein
MAWRSPWLRDRTDPLGRSSSSSKGHGRELAIGYSFLVVLAGGPLRAAPATLLARSRLDSSLAGRPGIAGEVGGAVLGLDAINCRAGPLPSGPLGWVAGLRAEGPVRSVIW